MYKRRNDKMKKTLFVLAFAITLVFGMSVSGAHERSDILLSPNYVNQLKLGGETGWFTEEYYASTGYTWQFTPDNSGVYKLVETITLHPSPPTGYTGAPGRLIWILKSMRKGIGSAMFELIPPGKGKPVKTIIIKFKVN
jgi:predicted secreted protein